MHPTALMNCKNFFDCYGKYYALNGQVKVLDIGSQDVNGSLRSVTPQKFEYVGVDFVAGKGVDIILDDPYSLPFEDESADIILSSSCFEHSEMFWVVFLEIMRVLKPRGLFFLSVPSNGIFHRYPVDCWRFYPDSGNALVTWANRNSMNITLLESYISGQMNDIWNDSVAIYLKDKSFANQFTDRVTNNFKDFNNGFVAGNKALINYCAHNEDQKKLSVITQIIQNRLKL